jgi:flagellar biogenesis protein FliO
MRINKGLGARREIAAASKVEEPAMRTLINFAAIGNLILLLGVIAMLSWFLYRFGLRRIIRARRISHARERRLLQEAAERQRVSENQ